MRTVLWTVFLVVALQGMATASTAFASPAAEGVATAETLSVPDRTPTRLEASAIRIQPAARSDSERKPVSAEPQVLSKSFANPKPVQIYWFFGGR
jgi:hypothetical protein